MKQLPVADPSHILFGYPEVVRRRGRLTCLLGTGLLLAASVLCDRQSPWWGTGVAGALCLMLGGAVAMLRMGSLDIDLHNRRYRYRPGPIDLRRAARGSADDFRRIDARAESDGTTVALVGHGRCWIVAHDRDRRQASRSAHALGELLGLPVRQTRLAPARMRCPSGGPTKFAVWMAIGCAVSALAPRLADAIVPVWLTKHDDPALVHGRSREMSQRGAYLYAAHDIPGADAALLEALRADDNNIDALNLLARVYADQHRTSEALGIASRALALAPKNGSVQYTVARIQEQTRNYRTAATFYEHALTQLPPQARPRLHLEYGHMLLVSGHVHEARQHLAAAVRLGANDGWAAQAFCLLEDLDRRRQRGPAPGTTSERTISATGM